jgi:hypothetical protein
MRKKTSARKAKEEQQHIHKRDRIIYVCFDDEDNFHWVQNLKEATGHSLKTVIEKAVESARLGRKFKLKPKEEKPYIAKLLSKKKRQEEAKALLAAGS